MAGESYVAGMPRRKRDRDGIYDNGDGWLWLQWKGDRISLKTKDRAEARLAAKEAKRRAADPALQAAHEKPLAEALDDFRTYAKTGDNRRKAPAAGTFSMYNSHFSHFVRIWGPSTKMGLIDATAVDQYIEIRRSEFIGKPEKKKLVSPLTVDKELGTLRQVLRLGLRRGWYHQPIERVVPDSAGGAYVPLTRHLTLEQVPKLLDALAASPFSPEAEARAAYCAYIVAFAADVVAAERAERDDLGGADACNLMVLVRGTKNAKRWDYVPVVAPFHAFAERARVYLAEHGAFPPWGKSERIRMMAAACRRASLPRVTPRDLRRTHGKILAAIGVEPHLIGRMLRHADGRMAERVYAAPERADVARQVAAVTRKVG